MCGGDVSLSLSPFFKSPLGGLPFDFVFGVAPVQAPSQAPVGLNVLLPFVPDLSETMFSEFPQVAPTTSLAMAVPQGMMSPQDSGFFSGSPSESLSDTFHTEDFDTTAQQKRRKRKHASDLSAEELARMREINRVAAQRHRQLAKVKQADQQRRLDAATHTNDELHREVERVSSEVSTLKRLVLSMYGPGGPRSGALSHVVHLHRLGAC
jgi:hypothetical protein